jgi:hypothetical protein
MSILRAERASESLPWMKAVSRNNGLDTQHVSHGKKADQYSGNRKEEEFPHSEEAKSRLRCSTLEYG